MTREKSRWGFAFPERPSWPAQVAAAALLAGLVFCLPDLLILQHRRFYERHFPQAKAQWTLGGRYTAIAPYDDPDANSYAARVNEAARHLWPMDPNIKENKSLRLALTDPLSFMFLGGLVRLTGGISRGWLLARGLCGAAWVASISLLIGALSGRRRFALACAVGLTLFYELASDLYWPFALAPKLGFGVIAPGFRYLATHLLWIIGSYQANFGASRLISPALNQPPFFLACFGAWKAAGGSRPWARATGLLGGALAYIHPDVWHVFITALGLFCLAWSLARRRPVRELWAAFAVAFAFSLPWLLSNYPIDPEILARAGGVYTHAPSIGGVLCAAAAAAGFWFWRGEAGPCFISCVFAAVAMATETQIVTGYTVETARFIYVALVLAFIAAAGLLGRKASESRRWLWLTAAFFVLAAGRAVSYAAQRYPFQGLPGDLDAAFSFLNAATPADSVVVALAPQETMLIPVYTHDKTFNGSGYNMTCDIPVWQLFERLHASARLLGVDEGKLLTRLESLRGEKDAGLEPWDAALWTGRVDWQAREWKNFFDYHLQTIPRGELIARLRAMRRDEPYEAEADYLWVGPFERGLMSRDALKRLGAPLYANATVSIYRVKA